MHPIGDITKEHINNEIQVAVKLCKPDGHKNIVAVLRLGKLPNSSFYYIDMVRCDMKYIET
jgi:hypothetical protein